MISILNYRAISGERQEVHWQREWGPVSTPIIDQLALDNWPKLKATRQILISPVVFLSQESQCVRRQLPGREWERDCALHQFVSIPRAVDWATMSSNELFFRLGYLPAKDSREVTKTAATARRLADA